MPQSQVGLPETRVLMRPVCSACGTEMWLVTIEPDKPDYDRRAFECPRCQHEESVVVKYK
jgi:DNA-directed RNA polymerase subunit RPC12/RpoP